MAIPTLLLPLDGDLEGRDRDGPITATGSGALRWVPGMGGYPARINYARNPTADESDYAFSNIAQGVTRTWEPNGGRDGKGCVRWDCDGEAAIQGMGTTTTHGATAGELWTVGAWVKGPAGQNLRILLREGVSGSYTSHNVPMTGDWQWISESRVFETNATVHLRIDNAGFSSTPYTMWVDDVIITPGTLADEIDGHVNGDMGPGFGWLGTPHQSESYREAWALGGAVVVEEGTTNYVKNGTLGTNSTGWSSDGNLSQVRQQNSEFASGWGLFVPNAPNAMYVYNRDDPGGTTELVTNSETLKWSSQAKVIGAGTYRIETRFYHTDGTSDNRWSGDIVVPTDEPTVIKAENIDPLGDVRGYLILIRNLSGTRSFWVGDMQLEAKPYATSFCPQFDRDGNLLPGYSWAGEAHASASTRAAVNVSHDVGELREGAMVVRARWPYQHVGPLSSRAVTFDDQATGSLSTSGAIGIGRLPNGRVQAFVTSSTSVSTADPVPDGEWHTYLVQWDDRAYSFYMDGELVGSNTAAYDINAGAPYLRLDSNSNGGVEIDTLMVFDRILIDTEIAMLADQPTWTWQMLYPRLGGVLRVDGGGAPFSVLRAGYGEG